MHYSVKIQITQISFIGNGFEISKKNFTGLILLINPVNIKFYNVLVNQKYLFFTVVGGADGGATVGDFADRDFHS